MKLKSKNLSLGAALTLPLLFLFQNFAQASASAPTCDSAKIQEILEPASEQKPTVAVRCNLTLKASDKVSKRLIIQSSKASNITIDCQNALIDGGSINRGKDIISISSSAIKDAAGNISKWDRPENVTIKNCRVTGAIRISGMAPNGEGALLRDSSRSESHTFRAQAAAPKNIKFSNMKIMGESRIPFYISPGVTYVTLENSEVSGTSSSVAIYLDAESAYNTIRNNYIHTSTEKRELLAVDGSAFNTITGNRFSALNHGGIYLYRNCGEGGTVRHQTPSHNQIINNSFYYDKYAGSNPAIFLASRNGKRIYCNADNGYPFGSSSDNRDFARYNVIVYNQFLKLSPEKMIRQNDSPNFLYENIIVDSIITRKSACYKPNGYPNDIIQHGKSIESVLSNGYPICDGQKYECNDGVIIASPITCPGRRPQSEAPDCSAPGSSTSRMSSILENRVPKAFCY